MIRRLILHCKRAPVQGLRLCGFGPDSDSSLSALLIFQVNAYAALQKTQRASTWTPIEIRPFRNGWQVYETAGVQPVFLNQEDAVDYATGRAWFRSGEIRSLDSGNVERRIPFSDVDRKL
jgi:hypothetical protein